MTVVLSPLGYQTLWFADHFDDPPWRLHVRDIEDGSRWGAHAFSHKFEQWLGSKADDVMGQIIHKPCDHVGLPPTSCPGCGGTGERRMHVERYRWPMRAALELLKRTVHMPPGVPSYASALWLYRLNDYNPQATCAALSMSESAGEAFLLEAIRLLRTRYSEQPIRTARPSDKAQKGYRGLSESQAVAEAAA